MNQDQFGSLLNRSTVMDTTVSTGSQAMQSAVTNGVASYLTNPNSSPNQVVLQAEIAALSAITQFFLGDATGIAEALGLVGGANSQQFITTGGISIVNLKEYLKTKALVVGGYNFLVTNSALLSNNLIAIYAELDTNSSRKNLFSAQEISNMQQNQNLLNLTQPFVWTNQCALRIAVASDAVAITRYTLTMKIIASVPYGQLDSFLSVAKIIERSKITC